MLNLANRSVAMVAACLLAGGVAASPLSCAAEEVNPAPTPVMAVMAMAPADAGAPDQAALPPKCDAAKEVLLPKCATAGCHSATDMLSGLDLESTNVLGRLSGKTAMGGSGLLVDPANPDRSVLYTKCTASPPFGSRMPTVSTLDDAAVA